MRPRLLPAGTPARLPRRRCLLQGLPTWTVITLATALFASVLRTPPRLPSPDVRGIESRLRPDPAEDTPLRAAAAPPRWDSDPQEDTPR